MRTPIEVIETIKPLIKGKKVCDLGCWNESGDTGELFVDMLEKCDCEVIGVDFNLKRPNVINRDIFDPEPLPEADVYYSFTHVYDIPKIIDKVDSGIIIFGHPKERFEKGNSPNVGIRIDIPFDPNQRRSYKKELKDYIWCLIITEK